MSENTSSKNNKKSSLLIFTLFYSVLVLSASAFALPPATGLETDEDYIEIVSEIKTVPNSKAAL